MLYDFDSMSNKELNDFAMNAKFKKVEKKEAEVKEEKSVTLKEIDEKIVKLNTEESKLRKEFPSSNNDRKRVIIERIKSIQDEYTFLSKLVKEVMAPYKISNKKVEEMSSEEINEELAYLRSANDKLLYEGSQLSNKELKSHIEKYLSIISTRLLALESSVKKVR